MHELSLIQAVMEIVEETAREQGWSRVSAVKLVVGKLTAALPESLRFCFDALKSGTLLGEAELRIEERPADARCKSCGARFEASDWLVECPGCASRAVTLSGGQELLVEYVEGE